MIRSVIRLRIIVRSDELIMMLSPRKNSAPVREWIRYDRETISPGLDDSFHVMKRRRSVVQEALEISKERRHDSNVK